MGRIVDVNGEPLDTGVLTEEISGPSLTGVRQHWMDSVANGITPERMTAILEDSIQSIDPRSYLMLAEEMEEREPQYFSQLGTRKGAVLGVEITVEAASDAAEDVKRADFVRELFELDCVEQCRADLLDGLGKSFSVCELIWDRSGKQWMPERVEHRPGQWFLFDQVDRNQLRLRDEADAALGVPLKPYKFIVHKPRLKTGLQIRNGLARIVAFSWICKAYALKNWMAFAEVFGMPVRVGKYGPSATARDINILRRAVANIGTDAAAVMPESMKLEFQQVGNVSGGADLFQNLCVYLDKQISKAVLGQTMTADDGSSLGQAEVHDRVRGDIRDSDCRQLEITLDRDLVRPAIDLNFGPQALYPKTRIRYAKPEDLERIGGYLQKMVPLGMRVEESWARDKIGAPEPDANAVLLGAPAAAAPPDKKPPERAQNRRGLPVAAQGRDAADALTDRLESEASSALDALMEPIKRLVEGASSLEQIRDGLEQLYPEIDESQLAAMLREAMAAAWLLGRIDVGHRG